MRVFCRYELINRCQISPGRPRPKMSAPSAFLIAELTGSLTHTAVEIEEV